MKQLADRAGEFTRFERSRLYIGTWNVGSGLPSRASVLDELLSPEYPNRKGISFLDHISFLFL